MTHSWGNSGESGDFEVRDGVIEPVAAREHDSEVVDWRERAVSEPPLTQPVARPRARPPEVAPARPRAQGRAVLAGAAVSIGLVALVAVLYSATHPDEVTAHCVDQDNVAADDENACDEEYVRAHGGYYSNGIFFVPVARSGRIAQYHYNYGGALGADRRVSGGSAAAPPEDTTVRTTSGKTVQRGGFGLSGDGRSGGA